MHPKGIHIWDRDGCLRLKTPSSVAVEELRADSKAWLKRALAGDASSFEVAANGERLWCSVLPLVDESGAPNGAVSILHEVGEDGQAETLLRERLAFEELVAGLSTHFVGLPAFAVEQSIHDALRTIGEFADVDRAYIFRFSRDGLAMDNTHEWCAPGIEPQKEMLQGLPLEVFPWWTARLRERQLIHVPEVRALGEEGAAERKILEEQGIQSVLAVPMICEHTVLGFLGFDSVRKLKTWPARDIALLRIAGEIFVSALERADADDARKHLETQLIQTKSLENVAKLAGGVAHDFNNLLAVILNYATLLQRKVSDPEQKQMVAELHDTAMLAADLTRKLLLVGRRDIAEPELLDVNDVVRVLHPLLERTMGDAVPLHLSLAPDLEIVEIGKLQLEQVIVNLTINARDALVDGGSVKICTENVTVGPAFAAKFIDMDPGRYVRLQVSDTGCGMSEAIATHAFDPFFTTKGPAGTGLGLTTVQGVVKRAGGQVTITSTVGKGTTVDVYIPSKSRESKPERVTEPRGEPPRGRGETVLVVDDSRRLRDLVALTLTENGYRVLVASTPGEAIRLCDAHSGEIAMILTDVIMPQMSGRALSVVVRDRFGIDRVLFMSGYDDDVIARHRVLEPGTRLLQKPFPEDRLLRAVRDVLDG